MKTETIAVSSWEDIVFTNRNKAYGAYHVRKSYSKSMIAGFGISVSLACLLIVLPQILSSSSSDPIKPPKKSDEKVVAIYEEPKILQPPPVAPPPPPPATNVTPPAPNAAFTPVTADVDTEIPTNDEINESLTTITDSDGPVGIPADVPPTPPVDNTNYNDPFTIVETPPVFEDGQAGIVRYISRNTKYPSAARRLGTEGTVYVTFVVDKDGKVVDAKIARGISAECDKEALRVISAMTGWTPGIQNKHKVAVRMTLPIKFQLQH